MTTIDFVATLGLANCIRHLFFWDAFQLAVSMASAWRLHDVIDLSAARRHQARSEIQVSRNKDFVPPLRCSDMAEPVSHFSGNARSPR